MEIDKNSLCNCGWCGEAPSFLFSDNNTLSMLWQKPMFSAKIWCGNINCSLKPTTGFVIYYKNYQDKIINDAIKEWNEINC